MERLDILSLRNAWPQQLSGGELRRMTICRALTAQPDLLFADEPTADLDDENTALVLGLLRDAARQGASVFVVTHEKTAADYADRVFQMSSGTLTQTGTLPHPSPGNRFAMPGPQTRPGPEQAFR